MLRFLKHIEFLNFYFDKKMGVVLLKVGAFKNKAFFSMLHNGKFIFDVLFIRVFSTHKINRKNAGDIMRAIPLLIISYLYYLDNSYEDVFKYYLIFFIIGFFFTDVKKERGQ